jgi:signal transduction histidine kinase
MGLRHRDEPGMLAIWMSGLMAGLMTQRGRPAYGSMAHAWGHIPVGPAMTALRAVAAWTACTIRCLAIGYIALQVIIWHSFYAADPWRLAGPVAAVLWAGLVVIYLRGRSLVWRRDGLDTAASVLLALGAGWCVPPAVRGDTTNWLYIALVGQLFVPAWLAPMSSAAPLALATAGAYLAGTAVAPAVQPGGSSPAVSAALLVAIAAAAWCARRMLERHAAAADSALAQADREASEQRVLLSRNTERREHERLLHDTILNTLTALSRSGGVAGEVAGAGSAHRAAEPGELVGRCQRDVALMEYALSDPGDPAKVAGRPFGGLLIGIEAAAIEMRARGLDVHVAVTGGGSPGVAAGDRDPAAGVASAGAPAVPARVAIGMAYAVREALTNVVSHAGTGEAWVEVSLAGDLRVTVRDAGAGFDSAAVDPARLGLRRSIEERLADLGGRASIRSGPGQGTMVSLHWAPPAPPGPEASSAELPALGRMPAWDSEIPRMAGMVAAVWQVTLLIPVLIYLRDYRQPAVPVAVWLGLLAAAAWLVPRARAGGLNGPQAAAAMAIALGAVILVGWDRRTHGATGAVDWSVFGTAWLLALVVLSRPAWVWVSGALAVFAAHAFFVVRVLGVTPLGLERLAAAGLILVVFLVVFAALRPTMRTHAQLAAHRAALASRSAAERAAVAAVREDRRQRLSLLELEALPLLRGIAGATLDPADAQVRDRCARHAAELRRALADHPRGGAGLLAELEPALRSARARGLPVEVQVVGDPGRPVPPVAAAARAAMDSVLSTLQAGPVMLTVLGVVAGVELYLIFDRPPSAAPDLTALERTVPAAACWRATFEVSDTGAGCLELSWQHAESAAVPA